MMRILKTKTGGLALAALAACLTLTAGAAFAVPTVAWTGANYPSDISADGSVVVGNSSDGTYETFRWTELTGAVMLGGSTASIGTGAGIPEVSNDGQHVSATVIDPDSTRATQGIWTKGIGWEVSMPPIPPTGGPDDHSYGSAWGISGDGTTLTGLFWRYGQPDGSAHANSWNRITGVFTELPTPHNSCRGNGISYDGSVVVGWSERTDGVWSPTVWENGGVEVIADTGWFTEAKGVSDDGNTVWGNTHDPLTNQTSATIWKRTDSGWDENILGVLPGTAPNYGEAFVLDLAEIGNIAVGLNSFTWGNSTGFVWTLNEGMVSAIDFFNAYGLTFDPNFVIDSLTGISHDGMKICGYGHDKSVFNGPPQGFVVTMEYVSAVPVVLGAGGLAFEPNFPNPFNPSTTIALSLDVAQTVQLDIFDARGRLVRTLHDGILTAGRNELMWDGRDNRGMTASSGMYFSRATGMNGTAQSQRMMLVK